MRKNTDKDKANANKLAKFKGKVNKVVHKLTDSLRSNSAREESDRSDSTRFESTRSASEEREEMERDDGISLPNPEPEITSLEQLCNWLRDNNLEQIKNNVVKISEENPTFRPLHEAISQGSNMGVIEFLLGKFNVDQLDANARPLDLAIAKGAIDTAYRLITYKINKSEIQVDQKDLEAFVLVKTKEPTAWVNVVKNFNEYMEGKTCQLIANKFRNKFTDTTLNTVTTNYKDRLDKFVLKMLVQETQLLGFIKECKDLSDLNSKAELLGQTMVEKMWELLRKGRSKFRKYLTISKEGNVLDGAGLLRKAINDAVNAALSPIQPAPNLALNPGSSPIPNSIEIPPSAKYLSAKKAFKDQFKNCFNELFDLSKAIWLGDHVEAENNSIKALRDNDAKLEMAANVIKIGGEAAAVVAPAAINAGKLAGIVVPDFFAQNAGAVIRGVGNGIAYLTAIVGKSIRDWYVEGQNEANREKAEIILTSLCVSKRGVIKTLQQLQRDDINIDRTAISTICTQTFNHVWGLIEDHDSRNLDELAEAFAVECFSVIFNCLRKKELRYVGEENVVPFFKPGYDFFHGINKMRGVDNRSMVSLRERCMTALLVAEWDSGSDLRITSQDGKTQIKIVTFIAKSGVKVLDEKKSKYQGYTKDGVRSPYGYRTVTKEQYDVFFKKHSFKLCGDIPVRQDPIPQPLSPAQKAMIEFFNRLESELKNDAWNGKIGEGFFWCCNTRAPKEIAELRASLEGCGDRDSATFKYVFSILKEGAEGGETDDTKKLCKKYLRRAEELQLLSPAQSESKISTLNVN